MNSKNGFAPYKDLNGVCVFLEVETPIKVDRVSSSLSLLLITQMFFKRQLHLANPEPFGENEEKSRFSGFSLSLNFQQSNYKVNGCKKKIPAPAESVTVSGSPTSTSDL